MLFARSGFEACHFGKIFLVDFFIKGECIFGGLKGLFCRGSKTELSSASSEAKLMETWCKQTTRFIRNR